MNEFMQTYADLYASLDVLKPFDTGSAQSAFLLTGEDADGLCMLARVLAARLLGISVERAIAGHADILVYPRPDFFEQSGKGKKGKKTDVAKAAPVNVDEINDLINSLYLTPFELARRVYIVENADSMSEICQNKILKSLEEPPPRVCFILCATGAMLRTVQSRCIEIALAPFPPEVVREQLSARHKQASDESVRLATRASRGNLGMAERMLGDADFATAYADALKILKLATGSRAFAKTAAVYDKFTREHAASVLGLMEYLVVDVARMSAGVDTVFDRADVGAAGAGFTSYAAAKSAEFVRDAERDLSFNCMPQAVMDKLVLRIMEEKALCRK